MARRYSGCLYGLTSRHQVLIDTTQQDHFLQQPYHTLNAEALQYSLVTRVFGARPSGDLEAKFKKSWRAITKPVGEVFVNDSATTAAIERAAVAQRASSFVSFAAPRERWELSANIQVIKSEEDGRGGAVEADLQSLSRDFGACFSIPTLYGQDFMDRYPQLLRDLWAFDNDTFPLLMIGIPSWAPIKAMKEGLTARSRLIDELEALYRRVDQHQQGTDVDLGADMSDIGKVVNERNKLYNEHKWSFQERAQADLSLLWGQNANTQALFFWFLVYVYSTPGLVETLRREIAPHTKFSSAGPLRLESMDYSSIFTRCQRMKACLYETYRMVLDTSAIRGVARPVTLNDGDHKHSLKPGMYVSIPYSAQSRDPSIYGNPDLFDPERFLEQDPSSGHLVARYGRLRPWGFGPGICKGRTFAEKEILALGAAILSLWDIAPAGDAWKIPAMVPGTGAKKPVNDVRVVISRRKFS